MIDFSEFKGSFIVPIPELEGDDEYMSHIKGANAWGEEIFKRSDDEARRFLYWFSAFISEVRNFEIDYLTSKCKNETNE